MSSKLIICSNHLGNIDDLPRRTVKALHDADLVLCEDTRTCARLFSSLGIKKPLKSCYSHNEQKRIEELKKIIKNKDITVALISEAGMPLISDPGSRLVQFFHDQSLSVQVIPGPSAFLSAVVMSGLSCDHLRFVGFWPRKKGKQQLLIDFIKDNLGETTVFYESPYRVIKTLEFIAKGYPEANIFVLREYTKKYEEYWKGNILDVIYKMKIATIKGELTVVLG